MHTLPVHPLATGFDRNFLDQVRGGFSSTGISYDIVVYVLIVLFGAVALFFMGKGVNLLIARFRSRDIPSDWIVNKQQINEILNKALDLRSKFEMKFMPADFSRRATICSLLEVSAQSLSLELDMNVSATKRWLNRDVEFFFRVPGTKSGGMTFYHFSSVVSGIKRASAGESILIVDFPDKIELNQKRSFLRLEPPSQYFLGCALWREHQVKEPADVKQWGKPLLLHQPGKAGNPIMVADISAGGLRLLIKRKAIRELGQEVSIANRFFLAVDLYDPAVGRKRRYWLQCRVQHLYEDFETKDVEYGLQFEAWGRPKKEDETLLLDWKTVLPDGVEPLGSWVMQRHLELYRDKGIA